MIGTIKTRLVWLLLALTLCQAWGASRHLHGLEAGRSDVSVAGTLAAAFAVDPAAEAAAAPGVPGENSSDEAECQCLWCSPRLHTLLAYALPMPAPPPVTAVAVLLTAATGFLPLPSPRGTVPPPRGPPA